MPSAKKFCGATLAEKTVSSHNPKHVQESVTPCYTVWPPKAQMPLNRSGKRTAH